MIDRCHVLYDISFCILRGGCHMGVFSTSSKIALPVIPAFHLLSELSISDSIFTVPLEGSITDPMRVMVADIFSPSLLFQSEMACPL
jgi:hypothetical protein